MKLEDFDIIDQVLIFIDEQNLNIESHDHFYTQDINGNLRIKQQWTHIANIDMSKQKYYIFSTVKKPLRSMLKLLFEKCNLRSELM
ncbi:hypothetical protein [Corallococcus praedator]|uniref:hypothetical protein n=1 Tax=Corallococcus praedator TaxID=2316724 RepID=UPI0011C3D4A0|nr:hypothetical protein [Corallococcus praedator]